MAEKKFKVNEYITLKFEGKKTNFYVKGKEFILCKFLLLDIPIENITSRDNVDSIDAVVERFVDPAELRDINYYTRDILPEAEFWGYCSNLQVWVENDYDTRLLHRNIAFPLLKKLSETGDSMAKKVFKDEIAKRFSSGHFSVMMFLLEGGYLSNFDKEELNVLSESVDYESITNLDHELSFTFLRYMIIAGDSRAKKVFKEEIAKIVNIDDLLVMKRFLHHNYLKYLNNEDFQTIFSDFEFLKLDGRKILVIQGILDLSSCLEAKHDNPFSSPSNSSAYEIEGLEKLNSLRTLILEKNRLSSLPTSISNIISLRTLSLGYNRLKVLPVSIGNLTSLQKLKLIYNQLKTLPETIGNLSSLQSLDLYNNWLTKLPDSISTLTSLDKLIIMSNQLSTLPESIGDLKSLQILNLTANQLTTLPESIGNLTSLQKLYLVGNKLNSLPESIGNLTSLQILYIGENELKTLPESIGNLTSLQELYLASNHLASLPESIGNLTLLQELYLDNNQLTKLPESIGNLTSLQSIKLQSNQLTSLPESIGDLTLLQKLPLGNNQLTTLPESIGNLTSLNYLLLYDNKLTTLPKSIGNLTSLRILGLRGNPLIKDPDLHTKSILKRIKEKKYLNSYIFL